MLVYVSTAKFFLKPLYVIGWHERIVWKHDFGTKVCQMKPTMIFPIVGFLLAFWFSIKKWKHGKVKCITNAAKHGWKGIFGHNIYPVLMWNHPSRPQTVNQMSSVQTNQQDDESSEFENRRSPLVQWNVQAMEIQRNFFDPCLLSAQWIYKEQQCWLCTWCVPIHVTTPVFFYFIIDHSLWPVRLLKK